MTNESIFPEQISMPVHALAIGSSDPNRRPCPTLSVGELHGTRLRRILAGLLPLPAMAQDGDIVGARVTGAMVDTGAMVSQITFLVAAAGRLHEYELYDLPDHQQADAAQAYAAIDHDWMILGKFQEEILVDEDGNCLWEQDGPRHFEMIHCRQAMQVLWLEAPRLFNRPPRLASDHVAPSAVLIQDSDLEEMRQTSATGLDDIRNLFERASGIRADIPH